MFRVLLAIGALVTAARPLPAADGPPVVRHPAPDPGPGPLPPPGGQPPAPSAPPQTSEPSATIGLSARGVEFLGVARTGRSYTFPVSVILYGAGSGQRWTARPVTYSGGSWLSVSPALGEDDAVLQITASVGKLARGTYTGLVIVSAEAQNSPQNIQVTFVVRDPQPAALELSATALRFTGAAGGENPAPQEIAVGNLGEVPLTWRAAATTTSGGDWLSATPASGPEGARISVLARLGALGPGEYRGAVTVTSQEASNSPLLVPVTFLVERPAPVIRLGAAQVSFAAGPGVFQPAPQEVTVANAGYGTLTWRAAAATFNGGPWLAVAAAPGKLILSADATGLPGGLYTGRVTVTAEGAVNSPAYVAVTLAVTRPRPEFHADSVVNAASLLAGPVAPEEIVSVFGARLWTAAGETTVTFDGVRAPLLFSSPGQLNLIVPREIAGKTRTRMVVQPAGLDPTDLELPAADAAPGVFTLDGRRAAALNPDNTLNTPDSPAPPGSVVQLFATGLGPQGRLPPVRVQVNAIDAVVQYAGPAPGIPGLAQINVEVPRQVGASDWVRVVLFAGETQAPPVHIAVRPPAAGS